MKCPKCGGNARYEVKAGYKTTERKNTVRTNFKAKCIKCGFEFDARDYYNVVPHLLTKEEPKKTEVKMKYDSEES